MIHGPAPRGGVSSRHYPLREPSPFHHLADGRTPLAFQGHLSPDSGVPIAQKGTTMNATETTTKPPPLRNRRPRYAERWRGPCLAVFVVLARVLRTGKGHASGCSILRRFRGIVRTTG